MAGGTFARIGRLQEITRVVAKHGLSHLLEQRRSKKRGEVVAESDSAQVAARAKRFRAILEELGPTFVKFGQILSTRPDLLPAGFAEGLRDLQDNVSPMPFAVVRTEIESAFQKPLSELFAEFSEVPVASASVAQVHKARLADGTKVAVKVQRPHIREQIIRDLDLLRLLAQLLEAMVEESGLVAPRDVVDEFESAFLGELDFVREARHMRLFADNAVRDARPYVIPAVFADLSCGTVLTMEFVEGVRLNELGTDRDKKAIATNVIAACFEQVFADGLFHADPHPGNAFVLPDNRIALLDFGSVGQISYAMRETLIALVVAIGTRDADTVARVLYRVGIPEARVSLHRLRDAVASLLEEYLGESQSVRDVQASKLLSELFTLASRFRLKIPSEYALIGRAAATVEGIIRQLDPSLEAFASATPYIKKLIEERFSMPNLGDEALRSALRARSFARELPVMGAQILMDLEAGKLQLQVNNPQFGQIARSIQALGMLVFSGLVACGLITGSLFVLAGYRWEVGGWPVLPIIGLYLASMLFGGAAGWYFLAPRLRKISLRKFFR